MPDMQNHTPTLVRWLFAKLIHSSQVEEFLGDLQEMKEERQASSGRFHARIMYFVDAIYLLIGFYRYRQSFIQNRSTLMFKSLLKITWRNAIRQKQFTLLNIFGLTLGIVTTMFIGLYIHDEWSYDTFHHNGERIYRVNQASIWGDWNEWTSATGPNVATALKTDIPELEEVTRLLGLGFQTTRPEGMDRVYKESRIYAAEENFFDVFSFKMLAGNPKTAFECPQCIVLTMNTATRYFGDRLGPQEIMGKLISIKNFQGKWVSYTVTGVTADPPTRSHIQYDALVSLKSEQEMMDAHGWKWIWTAFSTYVMVHEQTDLDALTEKLQELPPKWAPPTTERIFNQSFEEFTAGNPWKLGLQPIRDIYIGADPEFQMFGPTGNPEFVRIFAAIGLLVLILSVINFMNLSTARSTTRSKEVGVRKVLGSGRNSLIYQFVFESIVYVGFSTLLAIALVYYALPVFNSLAEKQIELAPYFSNGVVYLVVIEFVLSVGMLAGSYPSIYLSSFRPIETLKGKLSTGLKGRGIRNALVVFQFTISIALVICTFFVQKQVDYSSRLDVGFGKENVLQLHNIEQLGFETESFKNRLLSNPAFMRVGKSFGLPPNITSGDRYKAKGSEEVVQLNNVRTEEDYLDLLGLEFVAGRNFNPTLATDRYKVVLNEKAVEMLGWENQEQYVDDTPIGKVLALASGSEDELEVIGVVRDFNFNGLKREIRPLVIIHHQNDKVWDFGGGLSYYSMKLDPHLVSTKSQLDQVLIDLEEDLKAVDASVPFEFSFLDQEFELTFRTEQKMGTILNVFTVMAMLIACLGLFGLAAFSAEQRTKELGIRKVLGAGLTHLVATFSKEFTVLILVSVILATPVAYYAVKWWLSDFAYRTPIEFWVFAVAVLGALIVASGTISFQSLKIAHQNPVDSLKDE